MCEPYDPFDFPDLPDEAVVAIDNFLTEFLRRASTTTTSRRCTGTTTTDRRTTATTLR